MAKKKRPDKETVVNYILQCKDEADDATSARRLVWQKLWMLYQGQQDYSLKEDWQSKLFIPKVFMTVEQSSSTIKRAILQTERLFKLIPNDDDADPKDVDEAYEHFKNEIEQSNFVNEYTSMIKSAFLLGLGVLKRGWESDKLHYNNVDIQNFWIDPAYEPFSEQNPKYCIEYKALDLARLKVLAKRTNEASGKKLYDMKAIETLGESVAVKTEQEEQRQRLGLSDFTPVSTQVELLEFWGDIIDEDGEILENQLVILANGRDIIRWQDNPFADGKHPYWLTIPIVYPHRGCAGVSIVEPIAALNQAYNNIFNMFVDNLNFSVNKMYEVDTTGLLNPKELLSIYPGKTLWKNTPNQAVREVPTSSVAPEAFNALELLGKEIQSGSAVTEFIMGMPGKTAKTATEIEVKLGQSQGLFDVIARDLEENSIVPIMERSLSLVQQYGDKEIKGDYRIEVGGVSLMLAQNEQIQNVTNLLGILAKIPEMATRIDGEALLQKLLSLYNLSDIYKELPKEQPQPQQPQLPPGMPQQMPQLPAGIQQGQM